MSASSLARTPSTDWLLAQCEFSAAAVQLSDKQVGQSPADCHSKKEKELEPLSRIRTHNLPDGQKIGNKNMLIKHTIGSVSTIFMVYMDTISNLH